MPLTFVGVLAFLGGRVNLVRRRRHRQLLGLTGHDDAASWPDRQRLIVVRARRRTEVCNGRAWAPMGGLGTYGGLMRFVPWWAVLSSGCAPLLLVGGWSVAAVLHGPGYDPVAETISVMAADGASGRWVLTGVLLVLGICHLVTAWGLRPAAPAGRVALGCGGVAVMGMGLSPVPESGGSLVHGWVVAVGFALMALWPVLASDRDGAAPWGLRPALSSRCAC